MKKNIFFKIFFDIRIFRIFVVINRVLTNKKKQIEMAGNKKIRVIFNKSDLVVKKLMASALETIEGNDIPTQQPCLLFDIDHRKLYSAFSLQYVFRCKTFKLSTT